MSDVLPLSLDNLSGAAIRPIICKRSELTALPDRLSKIFGQRKPYAVTSPFVNVGATAGPAQVGRNITTAGYTIEQNNGSVLDDVNENTYTVQIPFAELRPDIMSIVHQSSSVEQLAATSTDGSGTKIRFGNVFDLEHYCVALVMRRKKAQGIVKESPTTGSHERGRWVAYVAYDASIQAENVQSNLGKGQLAQFAVTFKLNPEDGEDEGEEHGYWLIEDAQTLPAPT